MNDKPSPLEIHPDEHLEARITAYVLGEASPFEASEIEGLISKSPELKLFANRTRTLNALLKEAETTSSSPDSKWKLSGKRRIALAPHLGPAPVLIPHRDNRIRRASFRAAFGIAAVFLVTLLTKRFLFPTVEMHKESQSFTVSYSAAPEASAAPAADGEGILAKSNGSAPGRNIDAGGHIDAKQDTGKEVAKLSEPKQQLAERKMELAESAYAGKVVRREVPSEPTDEMAKVVAAKPASQVEIPVPEIALVQPSADFGEGDEFGGGFADNGVRSGDVAMNRNSIDSVLNNPELAAANAEAAVHIGGQVKTPGPQQFKEGLTLGDAVASAGGATEFGSAKRVKLHREGKVETYDLTDERLAQIELQPNDTIEMPQKNFFGCGASRDEALGALADAGSAGAQPEPSAAPAPAASEPLVAARRLSKAGKYDEARELLKGAELSAPDDALIKKEIAYLDDPIRTNPARVSGPLTEEHAKQIDEVRRKLYMAEGNFDLGKFDDAKKAYEDTLRIDPYNKAARRGMEKIAAAKSDYYRAAYDHTRSELLSQVDDSWELSVPEEQGNVETGSPTDAKPPEGADQDARAELLAEVDRAWKLSVPADAEGKKKGEANGQVDPFADPAAAGEFASLTGLFSDGIGSDFKQSADSNIRFNMDLRAGDELSDNHFYSEFDGFTNYGAPIAGEPTGEKITNKFTEITQANDKELGFDWVVSPFSQMGNISSGSVIPVTPATPTEFEKNLTGFTGEVEPQSLLADVAEGGLKKDISEDVSKIESEVPLLGDIPIAGKLFKPQPIDLADLSQEIPAAQEPFSTFSLNISDASFQLALAAVEKGERPDPASIKPEQFYNAVDYGDPAPSSLEPVAAAIDQTAHPVIPGRNLVRVAIRTASTGRSAAEPLRLTLLVDQSGSMARADRRAAMDTALAQLATLLTENDRITVIGFSRTPRLIADSLPGNEAGKISDLVNTTASEGGTNLEQAFHLSSELALRHKLDGAQNRIVLFTDGAANLGDADPDRLAERVKELRQQGLAFDIAGIGTNDTNDRLLSELARHGNGRYYLVGDNAGDSFAAQLAGAFRPAAENVKVQVKLNPERVGSYKLIGFEKDRLKTEDFRDDSVDAAELAADEAGVAIYQVETLPEGAGEIGEVSVRFRDTASGEMVERAWTIPHEPATAAFDKAAPQTQLATLALLAAQKLQGGPMADAIRLGDHAETIAKLKQTYANDAKAQRLLTLVNALR